MQYAAELLGSGTEAELTSHLGKQPASASDRTRRGIAASADSVGTSGRHASSGSNLIEEKRVSNRMLKEQLGVTLRFPTYREGLRAIHEGDQTPFDGHSQH